MTGTHTPPSERATVRRDDRADYDPAFIRSVLDEALICHVAFEVDGQPYVIPTIHCRVDDTLYLHGAPVSRMLRLMKRGQPVCVSATIVDGLVLARSWFHHSMNYRSVVVLGVPRPVSDPVEKERSLAALMDHVAPGRRDGSRPPTDAETRGTLVVALPLDEASAKVRTGPPIDEDEDLALDHWAGVLPLRVTPGEPVADPLLPPSTPVPAHVASWRRPAAQPGLEAGARPQDRGRERE